jgi:hypothetical protein
MELRFSFIARLVFFVRTLIYILKLSIQLISANNNTNWLTGFPKDSHWYLNNNAYQVKLRKTWSSSLLFN